MSSTTLDDAGGDRFALYQAIVENFSGGFMVAFDRHLRCLLAAGESWLGTETDPDSSIGQSVTRGLSAEQVAELLPSFEAALRGEASLIQVRTFPRSYRVNIRPLRNGQGEVFAVVAIAHDITEHQHLAQALSQCIEQQQALLSALPDLVFRLDRQGTILDCYSGNTPELLLSNPKFFLGSPLEAVLPAAIAQTYIAVIETVLATQKMQVYTYSLPLPQGERYFEARTVPCTANEVIAVVQDVSDRIQAETDLQLSEARFRLIVEQAQVGINQADISGRYIQVNPAFCQLTGYSEAELLQMRYQDLCHPDDQAAETIIGQQIYSGEVATYNTEKRYIRKDGRIVWADVSVSLLRDHNGTALSDLAVVQDITDRKHAECTLEQTRNFLQSVLEHLPVAVTAKDADSLTFTFWNQAATRLLGYPAEPVIGCSDYDLFPLEQAQACEASDQVAIDSGELVEIPEDLIYNASGESRIVHTQKVAIYDKQGQPQTIVCISDDVTERKWAEMALQESEATQRAVLSAIPDLLLHVDRHGNRLRKLSDGELSCLPNVDFSRWQSVYDVLPQPLAERRIQAIEQALRTGEKQVYRQTLSVSGQERHEETRVVPLAGEDVLVMVRDITEQVRAETAQAQLYEQLQAANAELQRLATTDDLTQVANRRYFDQMLQQEWLRSQRDRTPLALILCDIDCFKAYNDNYGHPAGDRCLQQVAAALQQAIHRPGDLVARYGGEEFALLLPNTDATGVTQVAEQIQRQIAAHNLPHEFSTVEPVITVSSGLSAVIASDQNSPEQLLRWADDALYQAKALGRNGYCLA
jgi:diguanylate cyclase (GGDEF)-like protein/PAS domain S-box-containing protein